MNNPLQMKVSIFFRKKNVSDAESRGGTMHRKKIVLLGFYEVRNEFQW